MKYFLLLSAILATGLLFGGVGMRSAAVPAADLQGVRIVAEKSHLPPTVAPVLERACRDCHSNQTVWPWYSQIPPVSFMIKHDVETGRRKFNFSRWADGSATPTPNQVQELCDAVSDHSMPPRGYRMMHPAASLAASDVDALCRWAEAGKGESAVITGR